MCNQVEIEQLQMIQTMYICPSILIELNLAQKNWRHLDDRVVYGQT